MRLLHGTKRNSYLGLYTTIFSTFRLNLLYIFKIYFKRTKLILKLKFI